jgi:hypothetical protein
MAFGFIRMRRGPGIAFRAGPPSLILTGWSAYDALRATSRVLAMSANLRIDGARLWDSLMDMAQVGPGVSRAATTARP